MSRRSHQAIRYLSSVLGKPADDLAWRWNPPLAYVEPLPPHITRAIHCISIADDRSLLDDIGRSVAQERADFAWFVGHGFKKSFMIGSIELAHAHRVHQVP